MFFPAPWRVSRVWTMYRRISHGENKPRAYFLLLHVFILCYCHINTDHFFHRCHISIGWVVCCSTLEISSTPPTPLSLILNTAINTACAVPPAAPPFALALVLQPRDWDVFIPVLCTSQAPSIILLKRALSRKWTGRFEGGAWWLFHGTLNLSTSIHSCCSPTLLKMTFCNVVYHFVLYMDTRTHIARAHRFSPCYKEDTVDRLK